MTNIKLAVTQKIPTSKPGQAVVLGVTKVGGKLELRQHSVDSSSLSGLDFIALGVSAKWESIARFEWFDFRADWNWHRGTR